MTSRNEKAGQSRVIGPVRAHTRALEGRGLALANKKILNLTPGVGKANVSKLAVSRG